jgi:hypothetical protein
LILNKSRALANELPNAAATPKLAQWYKDMEKHVKSISLVNERLEN